LQEVIDDGAIFMTLLRPQKRVKIFFIFAVNRYSPTLSFLNLIDSTAILERAFRSMPRPPKESTGGV